MNYQQPQFPFYRGFYMDQQQPQPFYYPPPNSHPHPQIIQQQQQQQQQPQPQPQPQSQPQPQPQAIQLAPTPPQPSISPPAKSRKRKQDPSVGPQRKPRSQPSKLFQCTGYGNCSMQFTRSEHLARHVRKHTGERPFKCHCGKAFSRLDNLRQHAGTAQVHADQPELNETLLKGMSTLHSQLAANASQKQIADAQVVDRKHGSSVPPESQRGRKRQTVKKSEPMSPSPLSSPIPKTSASPAVQTSQTPTQPLQHRSPFPNQQVPMQNQFGWSPIYHTQSAHPSPLIQHQAHPMLHAASMPANTQSQYVSAPIMDAHPSTSTAGSAAPPVLEEWSPHNQTPAIPHALRPTPTSTPIPLVRDTQENSQNNGKLPPIASVVEQHQYQQHQQQYQPPQQQQQQPIYQAPMLPSPSHTTTYKPHSSQGYRPSTSEYFASANYFDQGYQYSSQLQPIPFRKNSFQSQGMFGYQPPTENQQSQESPHPTNGVNWDEYAMRPRSSRKGNIGFNESIPYLPPPSSSGINVQFGTSRPMSSSEALRPLSSTAGINNGNNNTDQLQFNNTNHSSNVFKFDPITRADGEEVEEEDQEEERPDTNASRRQSILDLCGGEAGPRQQQQLEGEEDNILPPLKNVDGTEPLIGLGIKEEGLELKQEN
ncbi:hypothetical protein E3Q15_01352 [Wallemia mellicola]|uniref:C2H2-type domain-containing protein n=1 Tax=Wallemia mellicola TaxID=1708541 RepID=A0A4T0PWW3_9BASI|nr:hypothetical protein E3Q15_01352 [Wallemia mellicola]TIC68665.1 hypothetical protein E3Q01_00799 [Wallemia mellicola]